MENTVEVQRFLEQLSDRSMPGRERKRPAFSRDADHVVDDLTDFERVLARLNSG